DEAIAYAQRHEPAARTRADAADAVVRARDRVPGLAGAVAVARIVVGIVVVLEEVPARDVVDVAVAVVVDAIREGEDEVARVDDAIRIAVGHARVRGVIGDRELTVAVAVEAFELAFAAARLALGVDRLVVLELADVQIRGLDEVGVLPLDAGVEDRDDDARIALRVAEGERSEEHTSELQSREKLVCRLLLEKK